jgi:predicted GH43/DUF377 family glycosyl hydrolase
MKRAELQSWRSGPQIDPDRTRVLLRPFVPGDDARIRGILRRVSAISEPEARKVLEQVRKEFRDRHRDVDTAFEERYEQIRKLLPAKFKPSAAQRALIGSYFCHEYSLEAAALFNPSIVPHPDQSGVRDGSLRFVLSLRATGEGHISSIEFRSGMVDGRGEVMLDAPGRHVTLPRLDEEPYFDRKVFESKLKDEGCLDATTAEILKPLPDQFRRAQLKPRIERFRKAHPHPTAKQVRALDCIDALLDMNYAVMFPKDHPLSERVIFPLSWLERNGIEDARFVRFVDDAGTATYYATYTAYDGRVIRPLMIETSDFFRFRVFSLTGNAARNKGMALFPRKIRGKFAMISRQDAESLYLVYSDKMHRWDGSRHLLKATLPWELTQIGNCGSPIETEAGWLLLTHGVGPMRKYCIGAVLLDKNDPSRIIRRLREPLIAPDESEREGYVPNVVYTCGALVHNGRLVIPYAVSDYATRIASVSLDELLQKME